MISKVEPNSSTPKGDIENTNSMILEIDSSWKKVLKEELDKPYIRVLLDFLGSERLEHSVFPPQSLLFEALNKTSFDKVKVVILGQDPYHQIDQAHGLSFSVRKGMKIPPSLRNIYKELEQDIEGFKIPNHGNLTSWAEQGVLLLNTTLSVRENEPGSHQKKGWEELTDVIIRKISEQRTAVVFLLWGKFAQEKAGLIDQDKHFILSSSHPSPFSAYRGFLGSKPFSKTNAILKNLKLEPIDWNLPLV